MRQQQRILGRRTHPLPVLRDILSQGSHGSGKVRIWDLRFIEVRIFMVLQNSQENSKNLCKSQEKHEKKTLLLRLPRNFCGIQQNIPMKPDYY